MSRAFIISVLIYTLALTLSINGSTLWTDEAFSAWLASHETLRSLCWSLYHGDSSDLQMGLYYLYLFFWAKLFGTGEYALRAANIPFLFLFSLSLIWTSWSVFRSRIAWIAPAFLPFIWHYAGEARPYMAILAFGAAAIASLLGFIRTSGPDAEKFPWLCLVSILIGSCFHMLLLLIVPPMALMTFLAWRRTRGDAERWRYWLLPVQTLALPFCALASFFVFTFVRGTAYHYPRPGLREMVSVLYDLSGLSGFGPNRKFSLDFRSYLLPLAAGGAFLLLGAFFAFRSAWNRRAIPLLSELVAAVGLVFLEAVVLSAALRLQIDARHLAATVPFVLFVLIAAAAQRSASATAALTLLAMGWLAADVRLAILPEYQKEDYRDAVSAALAIQKRTGALIAVASDPLGPAYYGIDVKGAAPCYPIRQDCREAFAKVPWPREAPALDVEKWSQSRIEAWLGEEKQSGAPILVFMQRDRAHLNSPWWPVLAHAASTTRVHGFDLDILTKNDP